MKNANFRIVTASDVGGGSGLRSKKHPQDFKVLECSVA